MKYINDIFEKLPENIKVIIGKLSRNYKYGMLQVTNEEIKHEIIGYLGGLYDCGVITTQEREALYVYCIGKNKYIDSGYAYAYVDKDGKGFSDTEPFINRDFDTFESAKQAAIRSKMCFDVKQVCIFKYDKDMPESVTWDYVKQHLVDREVIE